VVEELTGNIAILSKKRSANFCDLQNSNTTSVVKQQFTCSTSKCRNCSTDTFQRCEKPVAGTCVSVNHLLEQSTLSKCQLLYKTTSSESSFFLFPNEKGEIC